MKRFFGEKNAPALSMLPQRSSTDFAGSSSITNDRTTGLTTPQPLSQGAVYSPAPSYGRNSVSPVGNALDPAQQQQHYFDLAAASSLYIQAVNTGSNAALPAPNTLSQPALTPPPPVLAQLAQQQQQQASSSSPLPSPGRLGAQLTSYPAVGPDDSASVVGQLPASDANNSLDRNDLHKILRSLEGLLVGLDEYRDLALKMAKVEKKIAKSAAEIAKIKSVKHVPSQVLGCSGLHFDALNETDGKHAKLVQKEYEAVNEACAKYFKRVAKEERAHDELVENLDSKIKKAHASQEKNAKRAGPRAMDAHDKYIAQVSTLTNDIAMAKASHSASMGAKTHAISLVVASTVGGLADARFRSSCESIRKTGKEIGPLNAWLNFAVSEAMPDQQPLDLDEDGLVGPATRLEEARAYAQAQAQAQYQAQLQAQAQATQAFAQAQMQNSAAAILAAQLQQQQQQAQTRNDEKDASADDASQGVTTMNSISPSQSKPDSSARAEATPSVKFADLPKLDSDGRLVSESSNGSSSQRTSNGPDFRQRIKAEDPFRSDPSTLTSEIKKLSNEPSQTQQQQPRSILTAPVTGRADTKHDSSVIDEADEDAEEDEDIEEEPVMQMKNVAVTNVSTPTNPLNTSVQETPDASSKQVSSNAAASRSGLSTQQGAKEGDDMLTSSVANLAATLTIPGGPKGNDEGDKKELNISDTSSSRLRESSSSTADTASRGVESDSTPALTNSSSRPSSEESAPVPSPRPLYPMRQTATPSAIEEEEEDKRVVGSQKQAGRVTLSPRRFPSADPNRKDASAFDSRDASVQDSSPYSPIVIGQSRITSASVSRTLSTDTTASERSFVARMKAKYQAEKEGLRQPTGFPTSAAPAALYDSGLPAHMGGQERGRRVSELASHYGSSSIGSSVAGPRHSFPAGGTPPSTQQLQGAYGGSRGRFVPEDEDRPLSPPNLHHLHTASTTSSSRGGPPPVRDAHYFAASTTIGAPSNQPRFRGNESYHDRYDEFGSVKSGRSSMPSSSVIRPTPIPAGRGGGGGVGDRGAGDRFGGGPSIFDAKDAASPAPHSDVCGCQRCSIRHYSDVNGGAGMSAGTAGNSVRAERGPYDSHSYRSNQPYSQQQTAPRNDMRDWERDPRSMSSNNRRQTMPVPPSSNPSAFSNGRYNRDDRDRERVVSGERGAGGGGGPSYGAQYMRPPQVNEDRYGGGSLPRDGGGRSGRTSPYGMNLARDEARFAQGRAQAIR